MSSEHEQFPPLAVGQNQGEQPDRARRGGARDQDEPAIRRLSVTVGLQPNVHRKQRRHGRDEGHARGEGCQDDVQPDELVAMRIKLDVDEIFRVVDVLGKRLHPVG